MSNQLAQLFRAATGAKDKLRIKVTSGDGAPLEHEFDYPYAVIGRGEGCDILLQGAKVSFRHAYLQVIEGRVFCVDLGSRNGVLWSDGPRKYGWLAPGEPIQVGAYVLEVVGGEANDQSLGGLLADLNPLERYRGQVGPLPCVDLEFRYESANQPTWSVNRMLTLIGRSPLCKLRLGSSAISAVHCSLLLTRNGLWAIDLMGRGGTKVDGQNIRVTPLESGNEIVVGNYQIGVFYDEPIDVAAAERLTDNAAESETSMDDLESPFLHEPHTEQAAEAAAKPESDSNALEWMGTIFSIDGAGDALIVIPMIDGCGFRYQQLHIEANSLQRKFDSKLFVNLVIDLRNLNYFGSELIGVLIKLARTVTNGNGSAAFCSPSARMLEVLESMRLSTLWPVFSTREEALEHVRRR